MNQKLENEVSESEEELNQLISNADISQDITVSQSGAKKKNKKKKKKVKSQDPSSCPHESDNPSKNNIYIDC